MSRSLSYITHSTSLFAYGNNGHVKRKRDGLFSVTFKSFRSFQKYRSHLQRREGICGARSNLIKRHYNCYVRSCRSVIWKGSRLANCVVPCCLQRMRKFRLASLYTNQQYSRIVNPGHIWYFLNYSQLFSTICYRKLYSDSHHQVPWVT
jgi:hypothetical protein